MAISRNLSIIFCFEWRDDAKYCTADDSAIQTKKNIDGIFIYAKPEHDYKTSTFRNARRLIHNRADPLERSLVAVDDERVLRGARVVRSALDAGDQGVSLQVVRGLASHVRGPSLGVVRDDVPVVPTCRAARGS